MRETTPPHILPQLHTQHPDQNSLTDENMANHSNDKNKDCIPNLTDLASNKLNKNDTINRSSKTDINRMNEKIIKYENFLNFKSKDVREWNVIRGRTIRMRVSIAAYVMLILLAATTTLAAPSLSRPVRSLDIQKATKSYLQRFGYLSKREPEVGNLLLGNGAQSYEDDFRIAIKTLQDFAGIPVTGEIDENTLELMKKKRCGRPDREIESEGVLRRKKRFTIHYAWKHTNLTWSLSPYHRASKLDPYATRAVLARALDIWAQVSSLTFKEVNSDDADIVISFHRGDHRDGYTFDGMGGVLAHAFFPGTGRGGDAHFDDDEKWLLEENNEDEEGTSLFAVAAHEFGHSVGLAHSSVRGALMYPYYQGINRNFVLPEDDRNGIQQMYQPKEKKDWGRIPNYGRVRPPPTTTTTTTTTTSTTTTRRPHINHYPDIRHYTPHRWNPNKYPAYYPRPQYPTNYPDRGYGGSADHPKRTHHHNPHRPETTPRPYHPVDTDYPKRRPYTPERTTPAPTTTTEPPSDKPDTCDTSYDAITLVRGELFIFKGRYHWRVGARGPYPGYPALTRRMWNDLPKNLTQIDAVYERPDGKFAFFIGKEMYLFKGYDLVRGYPKSLTDLGLPESLEKLDATMVWGHNGKTYFYSGHMYWKYDEEAGRVELDYPRDMSMWKGIGYNIDCAFQWKDGKTYFFKGKGFWKFNDVQMRVEHDRQIPSGPFWLSCPVERAGRRAPFRAPGSTLRSPSHAVAHTMSLSIPLLTSILLVLNAHIRYW